jgi:hypothetical protein
MNNTRLPPGLYIAQRYSPEKGVTHVALLDVGNRSGLAPWGSNVPVQFELAPAGLQVACHDSTGGWTVVRRIENETLAIVRLRDAWFNVRQSYDTLFNNCEHFVSYVETGVRKSAQVRAVVGGVGLAMLGVVLLAPAFRKAS